MRDGAATAQRRNGSATSLGIGHTYVRPPARNLYLLFRDSAVLTSSAEYFVRCIDEAVQAERANAGGKKRGTRSRAPRA
ncbi:hypothetical protein [Burkholderia lata]|uniref:hypothetical protein n=1 Tax=Burkholderia lata (strain ATCC 17760 / DSM 23089 / LMG 22485 / NCIMB 9086 / R18194 / 383) TaxID=482957 RepID=UPI001581F95F|nr:hypothetical protein [Burkholderia lata]